MKRLEKQLSGKISFITSLQICFSNLDDNYVKGLRVTKIVKQIKFEEECGELQSKYCFERQSSPKYMRKYLVLV